MHSRTALWQRVLCPHVLYQLALLTLVKVLESTGLLGPRGCCGRCGASPRDEDLRTQKRVERFDGPGGVELEVARPYLTWRCSRGCPTEVPVLRSCEVANPHWSIQQNASLLWHWARLQEPSGDDLADVAFVHAKTVPAKFMAPLRAIVAEEQAVAEEHLQLGGVGVDVEMDEVCFRWRKIKKDGETFSRVERYLCTAERVGRKMLLVPLPVKDVAVGGRTGAISNEELYDAIFPRGRPPVLLPGTIVHTDSAKAYRNLGWQGAPATEELPQGLAEELVGERPSPWRWESQEEADERAEAEAAEELHTLAGRTEAWASRYRHLRLVHTAVVHKKRPGRKRQYVVMRRCNLQPEDANVLRAAGTDPFLVGNATWRKGGTQKVDGYWRLLRQRVANRGVNSGLADQTRTRVLVHQWSHAAGPAADLFAHLGKTLLLRRERTVGDLEVGRRAWEEVGEEEVESTVPEHIHMGMQVWVEQVWRREAVVGRGTRRALEAQQGVAASRKRHARVALAHGSFAANAGARRVQAARSRAAAQVARAAAQAQTAVEAAQAEEEESRRAAEAAEAALEAAREYAEAEASYLAAPATPVGQPAGDEAVFVGHRRLRRLGGSQHARDGQVSAAAGNTSASRRSRRTRAVGDSPPREIAEVRLEEEEATTTRRSRGSFELARDACETNAQQRFEALQLMHPGTPQHAAALQAHRARLEVDRARLASLQNELGL